MDRSGASGERHRTLDIVRGVAVIGILVVNIGNFAMPSAARLNPTAWGGTDPLDLALWALNWVAFDNKMRGLFSLLFGASLLVVTDRARASGRPAWAVQGPRLLVLLALGALHYVFLWDGDILMLYAIVGAIALAIGTRAGAQIAGAAAYAIFMAAALAGLLGWLLWTMSDEPDRRAIELRDLSLAALSYPAHAAERLSNLAEEPVNWLSAAPDTLGLMLLGMVLLRNGLLTGDWERARALRLAWRAGLLGGAPLIGLVVWQAVESFSGRSAEIAYFALAYPFNIALTGAWAAGLSAWASGANCWLARALEATGRTAFTNYIATSLVMTTVFYGYGGGLYGQVTRWQAWLFVLAGAALMLAWSRPWLVRFRYGPLEWLWRSASRGRLQPLAGGALAPP